MNLTSIKNNYDYNVLNKKTVVAVIIIYKESLLAHVVH